MIWVFHFNFFRSYEFPTQYLWCSPSKYSEYNFYVSSNSFLTSFRSWVSESENQGRRRRSLPVTTESPFGSDGFTPRFLIFFLREIRILFLYQTKFEYQRLNNSIFVWFGLVLYCCSIKTWHPRSLVDQEENRNWHRINLTDCPYDPLEIFWFTYFSYSSL